MSLPNLSNSVVKALHHLLSKGNDHHKLEAARLYLRYGATIEILSDGKLGGRPLEIIFAGQKIPPAIVDVLAADVNKIAAADEEQRKRHP